MSDKKEIIDKKTADYWNRRGETYETSWASVAKKQLSALERHFISNAIKLIKKKNTTVKSLDIGIGTGRISKVVLRHNFKHYGIDISKTMVDYSRGKFKNNTKIKQIAVHDILNPLPEKWGKFDFVSAIRVLSYTLLWQKELRNIYNSMTPGGIFIFTFPNKYSSMSFSRLIHHRNMKTTYCDISKRTLEKAIRKVGFSEYNISGFSKLLDIFYDWSDSKASARILFSVEKILNLLLGKIFLTRLFYVVCRK